jgi:hypothetical protein
LRAALQFEEIKTAAKNRGKDIEKIDLQELREIIKESGYEDKYLFSNNDSHDVYYKEAIPEKTVDSNLTSISNSNYEHIDSIALLNMLATGAIDIENKEYKTKDGVSTEFVGFNDATKVRLEKIYRDRMDADRRDLQNVSVTWAKLSDSVRDYEPLEKSLLWKLGDITFGRPEIYTSSEKNLILPENTKKNYDVYWIEFYVTFWDLTEIDLDEMAVNFAVPENSIALGLAPLSYGIEVAVSREIQTPEIEGGFGGINVKVGEIYSRQVGFTYLKPLIRAFGVGQSRFTWTITEEAIRTGTHKFVAVLGVPRGTSGTNIAMSGHVRLSKTRLFGGDGELAGTDPVTMYLSF